jgi:hypothetical protein
VIGNRNMQRGSKKRFLTYYKDIDVPGAIASSVVLVDPENDIKIQKVSLVYHVATDATALSTDTIRVGTIATPTLYCAALPVISTAAGTVTNISLSSTAPVPAGTALCITASAFTANANVGAVSLVVAYELVDRGQRV